jgi:hypothetical protein
MDGAEQYFGSGHVDAQVIEDIASWVTSLPESAQ